MGRLRPRWRACSPKGHARTSSGTRTSRPGSAPWPGASGSRSWPPGRGPDDRPVADRARRPAAFRPPRRAALRHDPARGQRGHRQDVHDRRPGHPVRGRGAGHRRPAAHGHLRSQRHSRAAGARPRGPDQDARCPARPGASPARRPTRWSAASPDWPRTERDAALERLTRATADFDSATIATTHQFCLNALAGLGVNADKDPGETLRRGHRGPRRRGRRRPVRPEVRPGAHRPH